jgi:hypothetical protein
VDALVNVNASMPYTQPTSPFNKLKKTTKGKGRHFLSAKEGAGMTAAGRSAYNKETGGDLKAPQPGGGKRRTSYCAR